MNTYLINKNHTLNGKWRIKSKIENYQIGYVKYDESISLPVLEFWSEESIEPSMFKGEMNAIGFLRDGTPVTLLNISLDHLTYSNGENSLNYFKCNIYGSIIIGAHYNCKEEIEIIKIETELSGLPQIIPSRGFSDEYTENGIKINYTFPENIFLCDYKNIRYSVSCKTSFSELGRNRTIYPTDYILIQTISPLSFDEVDHQVRVLNNFLVYIANKRSNIESLSAIDGKGNKLEILNYWYRKKNLKELNEGMAKSTMFDKYDIGETLYRWLKLYEIQETAMSMYFFSINSTHHFIEEDFVLHVQIFEDLYRHSKAFRQERNPEDSINTKDEEYHIKCTSILNSCPDEYKDWLADKFKISNEYSLPDRIHEIMKIYYKIFEIFLNINGEIKNDIVNKIVGTRNYNTHRSDESKRKAVHGYKGINKLKSVVKTLIHCIIMNDMGYDKDVIYNEIYCKESFYLMLTQLHNKHFSWDEI